MKPGLFHVRVVVVIVVVGVLVILAAPSAGWVSALADARSLLAPLLAAQATLLALAMAVAFFAVERLSNHPDVDADVHSEYIARTRLIESLAASSGAVASTLLILAATEFGPQHGVSVALPGLANLIPIAFAATAVSLGAPVLVSIRAMKLARPDAAISIRLAINARVASRALARSLRVQPASTDEQDLVRALQSTAEMGARAMLDARLGQFREVLGSFKSLVDQSAEDVMQHRTQSRVTIGESSIPPFSAMGDPRGGVGDGLAPLRDAVARSGEREHAGALMALDKRMINVGVSNEIDAAVRAGLAGFRGDRGRALRENNAPFGMSPEGGLKYLYDAIAWSADDLADAATQRYAILGMIHQKQLLAQTLRMQSLPEFEKRVEELQESHLQRQTWDWNRRAQGTARLSAIYARLILASVAAEAFLMKERGEIGAVAAYVYPARQAYSDHAQIADDIVFMLRADKAFKPSPISTRVSEMPEEWTKPLHNESESTPAYYPLLFLSVRLLELAATAEIELALDGYAAQIKDWMTSREDRIGRHVQGSGTPEKRGASAFERVSDALDAAVLSDEQAHRAFVASAPLDESRLERFTAAVYERLWASRDVEHEFRRVGAFRYVRASRRRPSPTSTRLVRKEYFVHPTPPVVEPQDPRTIAAAVVDSLRPGHSDLTALRAALGEAHDQRWGLGTPDDCVYALRTARAHLDALRGCLVLLAGSWNDDLVDFVLTGKRHHRLGMAPSGQRYRRGRVGYLEDTPVFLDPSGESRGMYVVDLTRWGCLVRGEAVSGQEVLVAVRGTARTLDQDAVQPRIDTGRDEDEVGPSHVEVEIGEWWAFRVIDATRAIHVH